MAIKQIAINAGVTDINTFIYQVQAFQHATRLNKEDVARALIAHARQWSGCVNCLHSRPYDKKPKSNNVWLSRSCVLGLAQGKCGKAYKPIV